MKARDPGQPHLGSCVCKIAQMEEEEAKGVDWDEGCLYSLEQISSSRLGDAIEGQVINCKINLHFRNISLI